MKTRLITTGSPQELRRSLSGRKIKVQLQHADDTLAAEVKKMGYQVAEVTQNSILISVNDPEEENPAILRSLQAAGGQLVFVTEVGSSLEEVYLKQVRGE